MKLWIPLATCCVLVVVGLSLRACPGIEDEESRKRTGGGETAGEVASSADGEGFNGGKPSKTSRREESPARALIRNKLKSIIIPKVDFEDTTVEEAIDFMRLRARELDSDPAPAMKGVSMVIREPREVESKGTLLEPLLEEAGARRIKALRMENVSAWELLHTIARETGLEIEITDTAIVIGPR